MAFIKGRAARLAVFPVFLVLALTLAGCGDPQGGDPGSSSPPPSTPAPGKVKVEFRPPESGERLRRHIYAADGITEVETQIEYADGRMGYRYFRADGTLRESKETHPGGRVVREQILYAADGKTVTAQHTWRIDGTAERSFTVAADGSRLTVIYRLDGKRKLSEEVVSPDSSSVKTFYRKDGATLWARFVKPAGSKGSVEYFAEDGRLDHKRIYRADDGMDIEVYRSDGTMAFKQSWRLSYSGWYYKSYALQYVEEYRADGKTLERKLTYSLDGRDIRQAESYGPDGKKTSVRYFRFDETLEREDFFDSSGKIVRTVNHDASEKVTEPVDDSRQKEPLFDDPSDPYRRIDG